jgi:hypothetical protein
MKAGTGHMFCLCKNACQWSAIFSLPMHPKVAVGLESGNLIFIPEWLI